MASKSKPSKAAVKSLVDAWRTLGGPSRCTVLQLARHAGKPRQTVSQWLNDYAPEYGIELPKRDDQVLGIANLPPSEEDNLKHQVATLKTQLTAYQKDELTSRYIRSKIIGLADEVSKAPTLRWLGDEKVKKGSPGVPTLFLSDLHWGEFVAPEQINGVNEYSLEIANARLNELADTAVHLLRIISPEMNYPGIVIPLGGDMISGNLHEELTATNEVNTMPAVLNLFGALANLIARMADTFGNVFLPAVCGNHGRMTHKMWNKDMHATSFDWLLYCFLEKRFESDKRISFLIPDGPDASYKVYNTRYLLTHGNAFRGGDGLIGVLGPILRGDHKKRSRNSQIDLGYDLMLLGHFHQYIHMNKLIVNGSLKGYDEYAYNNNFSFEVPQQALWLTHPTHGVTYRMPVKLTAENVALSTSWVSVPERKK